MCFDYDQNFACKSFSSPHMCRLLSAKNNLEIIYLIKFTQSNPKQHKIKTPIFTRKILSLYQSQASSSITFSSWKISIKGFDNYSSKTIKILEINVKPLYWADCHFCAEKADNSCVFQDEVLMDDVPVIPSLVLGCSLISLFESCTEALPRSISTRFKDDL